MLPSIGDESDYGSLAQKMLDDLFNPTNIDDPPSPSPASQLALVDLNMLKEDVKIGGLGSGSNGDSENI